MSDRPEALTLPSKTVALFAGIDVVHLGKTAPYEPVLEISLTAVGRGGWREVVQHVQISEPFSDDCNDTAWAYLDLVHVTLDGRDLRVAGALVDVGYDTDRAFAFCDHVRSRINGVMPARGEPVERAGAPMIKAGRLLRRGRVIHFVRTGAAKAALSAHEPRSSTTDFTDSDAYAYAAEVLALRTKPTLRKALRDDVSITTDVTKTGDVTIILTSPDGEKVVVDTRAFIADVIAQHEKTEPLGDRLKRAEIALAEAKLARMRGETGTGIERFDRYVASAGVTDTKRVVMDHLYRTEPWLRHRVDQATREMMPTRENPYTPIGVWGVVSPNTGPVGEPA